MILYPTPALARVKRFFGQINFAAVIESGNRPAIACSEDARRWFVTRWPGPPGTSMVSSQDIQIYDGKLFVFMARSSPRQSIIAYTENCRDWKIVVIDARPSAFAAVSGIVPNPAGGHLLFGAHSGDYGTMWRTTDFVSFTPVELSYWPTFGASSPSLAILAQSSGSPLLFRTSNGITTTTGSPNAGEVNAPAGTRAIRYFPSANLFLYAVSDGRITTSANGTSWTARTSGTPSIEDVTGDAAGYVLVGKGNRIRVSSNLTSWSSAARVEGSGRDFVGCGLAPDGECIVAGADGRFLASSDRTNFDLIETNFPSPTILGFASRH